MASSSSQPNGEQKKTEQIPAEPGKRDKVVLFVLLALLAGFTLTISDYSLISMRLLSAGVLVLAACYLLSGIRGAIYWNLTFICPLLMACYGVWQTRWSDQKIVYNGWERTLYWFTLAMVAMVATQLFEKRGLARTFRVWLCGFGSGMALLDVLQQASHTGNYFWLIPSGFPDIYGTFPYYNNFAQFIELTLPVTLWEGLGHREPKVSYLLLSALQIGAVVAAGSRAGAALVVVELLAVLVIAYFRNRGSLSAWAFGLALVLSLGFTYLAGFDQVVEKLRRPDQLAARREINESSLAMIKARPLTGWGLGSYVPVYKAFALYDDGTYVNQAHNDYLEWAAEGGIPFALVMVVLVLWTFVPAVRTVWGVGLIAVALHALVDYPFARMGTSAWYFALAAMLATRAGTQVEKRRHRVRRSRQVVEEDPLAFDPAAGSAA